MDTSNHMLVFVSYLNQIAVLVTYFLDMFLVIVISILFFKILKNTLDTRFAISIPEFV